MPNILLKLGKILTRKKLLLFDHKQNRYTRSNTSLILKLTIFTFILNYSPQLCMNKVRQTLKLFEGTHNFASFALNKSSRLVRKHIDYETGEKHEIFHEPEWFIRTVDKICVEKVDSMLRSDVNPMYEQFDFYSAEFTSPAFFYNQVRKSSKRELDMSKQ